jgi:actin-related protein
MRHIKSLLIAIVILAANSVKAQSAFEKWPAIKAFHEVISQTFHPSEEGNLQPIKARSEELAQRAEDILKMDIPAEYKTKEILFSAEKLQIKAKALHKMVVLKSPDADIKKALSEVHDIFHEIVGLCSNEKH